MTSTPRLISVTVPAFNEEANLPQLYTRLTAVMEALPERYDYEVILFDNGSTDATPLLAAEFCERNPKWRYVRYSRNFGSEASVIAGLDFAKGDAVITCFSDLQDPPELIPQLIEKWEDGYQVVYGQVRTRNDYSILKTIGAKAAYWLIYQLTECKIRPNATDYRLLDRKVVDVLRQLRESDRYMRGLVHWVGFKTIGVPFDRAARARGESTAKLLFCIRFALNAIFCFSSRPLHLVTLFGACTTVVTMFMALFYAVLFFARPAFLQAAPPGITTIIILILLAIGLNSLFMGIIGEYIGRIYNQGKNRPLYIVDETGNLDRTDRRELDLRYAPRGESRLAAQAR